jgi:hypothetical protein
MIILQGRVACDIEGCTASEKCEVQFEHQVTSTGTVSVLTPVVLRWRRFGGYRWACPGHLDLDVLKAAQKAAQSDERDRANAVDRDFAACGAALPFRPDVEIGGRSLRGEPSNWPTAPEGQLNILKPYKTPA